MEYNGCYVCGRDNPRGMKLTLVQEEDGAVGATFYADECYQGWPGIVHGGVISSLLDEATAYVTLHLGLMCVTAEMNVSFLRPLRVGETVRVRAHAVRAARRLVEVASSIVAADGAVKARAHAKMWVLTDQQKGEFGMNGAV